MGIRSTNGVNDHLKALERKGYLKRGGRQKSRTMAIIEERPPLVGPDGTPLLLDNSIRGDATHVVLATSETERWPDRSLLLVTASVTPMSIVVVHHGGHYHPVKADRFGRVDCNGASAGVVGDLVAVITTYK